MQPPALLEVRIPNICLTEFPTKHTVNRTFRIRFTLPREYKFLHTTLYQMGLFLLVSPFSTNLAAIFPMALETRPALRFFETVRLNFHPADLANWTRASTHFILHFLQIIITYFLKNRQ